MNLRIGIHFSVHQDLCSSVSHITVCSIFSFIPQKQQHLIVNSSGLTVSTVLIIVEDIFLYLLCLFLLFFSKVKQSMKFVVCISLESFIAAIFHFLLNVS